MSTFVGTTKPNVKSPFDARFLRFNHVYDCELLRRWRFPFL
jgi:hypothetical protein